MRCKSCNSIIFQNLLRYDKELNKHEDLCHICKGASNSQYCYTSDHEYILENQKEGMTPPLPLKE